MNAHVIITTYNRPEMLNNLLDKISQTEGLDLSISVYDDCSDAKYSQYNISNTMFAGASYYRAAANHGKKRYFELVNKAFKDIPKADFYFVFPDDINLTDNFFERAVAAWHEVKQQDKICLNLDVDGRLGKECWSGYVPVDCGKYFRSQWVDMCFMCTPRFFAEVPEIRVNDRWKVNETLGSGVGAFISKILHAKSFGMYHWKEPLTFHGTHESKMNPLKQA